MQRRMAERKPGERQEGGRKKEAERRQEGGMTDDGNEAEKDAEELSEIKVKLTDDINSPS